jgi:anti-sigma factor RsiW
MNDCSPTRALLRAWLAEQLPEEEKAAVAAHLEACGSCSALHRIYQATVSMGAWPEAEISLPEELGEQVKEAVRLSKLVPEAESDAEAEMPENHSVTPVEPEVAPPDVPGRPSRRPPRRPPPRPPRSSAEEKK